MKTVNWTLITMVTLLSVVDLSAVAGASVRFTPLRPSDFEVVDLQIEERNWITKGLDFILGKTPFTYTTMNSRGEAIEKTVTRCPYTTQERVIFITMIVVGAIIGLIIIYLIAYLMIAFVNALVNCYDRYVN